MKRKKLGEILLEAKAITPMQLAEALEDQVKYGGKLGTILLSRRFITEQAFFWALSSQLRIPAVDFTRSTIPESVIKIIPHELAERACIFPVALKLTPQGKVLVLAMADPTNVEVQDEVRFTTGYKVEPALALETALHYVIRDYYFHRDGKGDYRMEVESEIGGDTRDEGVPDGFEHSRMNVPEEPEIMAPTEELAEEDRPQLSRELRALLKLLAKKGIISPREYLEAFKETK
jgi:type IV pilus assembly protein PilB